MLSEAELDALADRITDRLLSDPTRKGSGRLILPDGPAPAPPPPAPPRDPIDWTAVRVQLYHVLQILLTIGAAVLSGYAAKYGISASGTAEQAVAASQSNAVKIDENHADNVARVEAVHRDVQKADQKIADVAKAAAAPRPFTLPGGFDSAPPPKDAEPKKEDKR